MNPTPTQSTDDKAKASSRLRTLALVAITFAFVFLCVMLKAFVNGEAHGNFMLALGWTAGYGLIYALVAGVASVLHSLLFGWKKPPKVRLRVTMVVSLVGWALFDLSRSVYYSVILSL